MNNFNLIGFSNIFYTIKTTHATVFNGGMSFNIKSLPPQYFTSIILKKLFFLGFLMPLANVFSQVKVISLTNPSFESTPRIGLQPDGWLDCSGFKNETPPDVQPNEAFGIQPNAQHGDTYLGMVVRDNNTTECVAQRLKTPILKNTAYQFSFYACRSENYKSVSRLTNKTAHYTTPAMLEIWAASEDGTQKQKLLETGAISETVWKKFEKEFTPDFDYVFLIIKAYYVQGTQTPYNGNILIDNFSDIKPKPIQKAPAKNNKDTNPVIVAKKEAPVVKKSPTEPTKTVATIAQPPSLPPAPPAKVEPVAAPVQPKPNCPVVSNLKTSDVGLTSAVISWKEIENVNSYIVQYEQFNKFEWKTIETSKNTITLNNLKPATKYFVRIKTQCSLGQLGNISEEITFFTEKTFTIPNLLFESNSAVLPSSVFSKLDEIVQILKSNPSLEMEVGGHTNTKMSGDYAIELSEKRAKSVKQYFVTKGIDAARIRAKGFGNSMPIDRNDDRKNQRVEIRFY